MQQKWERRVETKTKQKKEIERQEKEKASGKNAATQREERKSGKEEEVRPESVGHNLGVPLPSYQIMVSLTMICRL